MAAGAYPLHCAGNTRAPRADIPFSISGQGPRSGTLWAHFLTERRPGCRNCAVDEIDSARWTPPRACGGCRGEGRQRPPRHRHEPGSGGLPALPARAAAQPGRPATGPAATASSSPPGTPRSPSTPSSTLAGFGLELERPRGVRAPGLARPRPPGVRPHRRASRPPPARWARASRPRSAWRCAARYERGLFDPDAAPGTSPFDHHIYAIAGDGDLQEGITAEASSTGRSPGARQPGRPLRRQPHLHRGRHRRPRSSRTSPKRYEAYGWHVQTVEAAKRTGQHVEDVARALRRASTAAKAETEPPVHHRHAHDHRLARARTQAEHRRPPRLRPRRRGGRRHQAGARLRPGASPSRSPARSSPTPAGLAGPRRARTRRLGRGVRRLAAAPPRARRAAATVVEAAALPEGSTSPSPLFETGKSVATRAASGKVLQRAGPGAPRAVGRLGRPGRVQQHHHRGREVVPPCPSGQPRCPGPTRTAAPCTSASASTPWPRR